MRCLVVLSLVISLTYGRVHQTPNLDGRIVGGENATIEEYPYQLALTIVNENGTFMCGASLIKPNVALTAAHCTEGQVAASLTIRAGTTYRGSGGEVVKVTKICEHPKFSPENSFDYDVSVLLLKSPLILSAKIQTIELQPENVEIPTGTTGIVTGWGRLTSGGVLPPILQKVEVPRVTAGSCSRSYFLEQISERMHCFGQPKGGKDACQGDSGGPLVVDGKQVGVVSWGYGCAWPKLPGVYAKVSNPEIKQHIDTCLADFS